MKKVCMVNFIILIINAIILRNEKSFVKLISISIFAELTPRSAYRNSRLVGKKINQ